MMPRGVSFETINIDAILPANPGFCIFSVFISILLSAGGKGLTVREAFRAGDHDLISGGKTRQYLHLVSFNCTGTYKAESRPAILNKENPFHLSEGHDRRTRDEKGLFCPLGKRESGKLA